MASVDVLPTPLQITTTPAELRALADKMEEAHKKCQIGESNFVEEWTGNRASIRWHFDFDKMAAMQFIEILPHLFEPGDVVQHCGRAYEITRVSDLCERDRGFWIAVKGERDPIFCSRNAPYKVRRKCATLVSTSKPPG